MRANLFCFALLSGTAFAGPLLVVPPPESLFELRYNVLHVRVEVISLEVLSTAWARDLIYRPPLPSQALYNTSGLPGREYPIDQKAASCRLKRELVVGFCLRSNAR